MLTMIENPYAKGKSHHILSTYDKFTELIAKSYSRNLRFAIMDASLLHSFSKKIELLVFNELNDSKLICVHCPSALLSL